jgi:hypothetical protein
MIHSLHFSDPGGKKLVFRFGPGACGSHQNGNPEQPPFKKHRPIKPWVRVAQHAITSGTPFALFNV